VADINSRLERLSRRDELTRRARQRTAPDWVTSVGDDVMEVVEAVATIIRRHPGMSVMLAPADGRPGSAVIRVSERNGEVEVAPVNVAVGGVAPPPAPRGEPVEIAASAAPTTVLPVSAPTPVPAGAPAGLAAVPGDDPGYDRTQPQPAYLPPQPGYAPEPYTRAHHARHSHATDPRPPSAPPPAVRPGGQHAYPADGQYPPYPGAEPYEPYPGGEAPTQYVEAQPQYAEPPYPDNGAPPDGERPPRGAWRQGAPDQPQYQPPVDNWRWER
jgi:hypothetical protein